MSSSTIETATPSKTIPSGPIDPRPPSVPFWNVKRHHRTKLATVLPYMMSKLPRELSLAELLRSVKWSSEFVKSGEASIGTQQSCSDLTEEAYRRDPTNVIGLLSDLIGVLFFTLVRYDFRFRFFSRTDLGAFFEVETLRNDNDYSRAMDNSEKSRLNEIRQGRPRYGTKFYRESYTYAKESKTWYCFCRRIRLFSQKLGIRHLSSHLLENMQLLQLYGNLQDARIAIEALRLDLQLSTEEFERLKPDLHLVRTTMKELSLRLDDGDAEKEQLKRTIETNEPIITAVRFRYLLEKLPGEQLRKRRPNGEKVSATERWRDFFTAAFDYAEKSKDISSALHYLVQDKDKDKLRAQGRSLFKTLSSVVHQEVNGIHWDPGVLKILRAIEPMQKSDGTIDLNEERRRYGPPEIHHRAIKSDPAGTELRRSNRIRTAT